MADEHTTTKLNPDTHLLLDQPLLRLPHELIRRNFKNVQRYVDREREHIVPTLKVTANAAISSAQSSDQTLAAIDAMIARMQTLKRKLENLHSEEEVLLDHSAKRIRHLQDLYQIPSLSDQEYEAWSRKRLDRLVVDYLLRVGYPGTATQLAQAKDIGHLIDLETFISCQKIAKSISRGDTRDALTWVNENRNALKKLAQAPTTMANLATSAVSNLEFELRLQQYVELVRANTATTKIEARRHANKYIIPHNATRSEAVMAAAGLLIQHSGSISDSYASLFAPSRWTHLSNLFVQTHHALLSLPSQPLLHTALSAGLSALKTPACHSLHNPASSATPGRARIAANTSLCPICSTELNELARSVPYAHHTKSFVEHDAVVLPNGRIYGRARLEELQRKILRAQGSGGGSAVNSAGRNNSRANNITVSEDMIGKAGDVTDPTTGEVFAWHEVKKVYIT